MAIRSEQVPLFQGDNFRSFYFDHPLLFNAGLSVDQFHLHYRCNLKGSIPAHRVDLYNMILVTDGEGIHSIGHRDYFIGPGMLCFVSPSQINSWQANDKGHRGFFCSFSADFVNAGSRVDLNTLPFFQMDGNAVIRLTSEQTDHYVALFRMMLKEHESATPFSADVLRGYLHVLLNKAAADSQGLNTTQQHSAGVRLLREFTDLYMSDINAIRTGKPIMVRKVGAYADALAVSQNHLNDTVKEITGHSAGNVIRRQLARQATMCLMHSSKSISEIAYQLGFDDPAYFTRFYKRMTGTLPSEIRVDDSVESTSIGVVGPETDR